MKSPMTRRELLRMAGVGSAGLLLAACQPKVVEVERIVEQTVVVTEEKVVKEAVEVAKEVTRVVEVERGAEGPAPLPPTSLRFAFPGHAQTYAEYTTAVFQARHPDVQVDLEPVAGDYNQRFFTMAAGGTLPEANWTSDGQVIPFVETGVSMDMQPMVDADPEPLVSDVYPIMLGLGQYKGGLYMIPWAADAPVMYYNKTLFQNAGVPEPPPEGLAVNDWIESLKAIVDEDRQIYGWLGNESWWAVYVPWMYGFGGAFFNEDLTQVVVNSPESVEACQTLADTYVKHKFSVPKGVDLGGNAFLLGMAACHFTNRHLCKSLRDVGAEFEWDVCLPPRQPVKHVAGAGTMGTSVSTAAAQRDKVQATFELVKTIVTPAVQSALARQYLIIPALQAMATDPVWYDLPAPPENRDVFLEVPKIAITPPTPLDDNCGTVYVGEIQIAMATAWEEMIIAGIPAQEALDKAANRINSCMAAGGV